MKNLLILSILSLLSISFISSKAQADTAWGATDADGQTTEMRIPLDISAAGIPSYFSLIPDVATGVFFNNSGNFVNDTGFVYDSTDNDLSVVGNMEAENFCDAAGSNCVASSTIITTGNETIALCVPLGTETGLHTTGTAKYSLRAPAAFTVTDVRASLNVAATGGTLFTVDINDSGTTILSTKITIDASELTSETAAAAPVVSDSAIADDALLTFDIDAIGSTLAGEGGKVCVIGTIN